ncbi:CotH kinase family protein [Haloferula sp. BvORR071]|uniref:CotH kinase family protein n=1 Tax=Haloferula sp. BvORR071 TaxID=1396141 RepID=UPI0005547C4A|nr:CotH kinase family protein [Haloferula sp. BvORR071]
MIRTSVAIVALALSRSGTLPAAEEAAAKAGLTQEQIFDARKVWDVHLTFTAEQWKAMEPVEGPRPRRQNGVFLQGPEGGRNGIAAAFGWQFNHARAELEFGSQRVAEVGVRVKGNGTFLTARESLKRSLKVDFNHFVKGQNLTGLTQLNLHNSVRDPSNTNEAIAYRIFRDCGVPAPRTSFAKVFVTVPGIHEHKYLGLYDVVEDVGRPFTEKHFGSKEGALLKPVTPQLFGDLGEDWQNYNQTYDPKGELSDDQKKRIIETCKFVSTASEADFAKKIGDYIDLENFARYLAITVWLTDLDGILGPGQNYYLYLHPKTGKFVFIPWDQDQGFGQFPRGTQEQRETLSIAKPWTGNNRFLERMFKVEAFQTNYRKFLKEFNEKQLSAQTLIPQVDELAMVLRAPIAEESEERLTAFQKGTSGEVYPLVMGPGYREPVQVSPLKRFVAPRGKSIDDQLAGRAQGARIDR